MTSPPATDAAAPVIELQEVCFGYGERLILDRVSLSIGRHDFLAVLGPNGGGKTTLLKIILGLESPWSGSVRRRFRRQRGVLGYVPQLSTFDPVMPLRVREAVAMGRLGRRPPGRRWSAADRRAVDEVLERLGLETVSDAFLAELSGGELQRMLIARALAGKPEALFLDEPMASLDPESQERMLATLDDLAGRVPVVVVTHDLTLLAGRVRQVACLNRRLVYHPSGELTATMLEEVYGCPVEMVAHGVPHRVVAEHRS